MLNLRRILPLLLFISTPVALAYEWHVPTRIQGYEIAEDGSKKPFSVPGADDIFGSDTTSQILDGFQVVSESTVLNAFNELGVRSKHQIDGTCAGHMLGQVLLYELRKQGLAAQNELSGQQMYIRLLAAIEKHGLDEFKNISLKWGTSLTTLKRLLKLQPKVCMMTQADVESLRSSEFGLARIAAEVMGERQPYTAPEDQSQFKLSEIQDLVSVGTLNEFEIYEYLAYPKCLSPNNNVDIRSLLKKLNVFERGRGPMASNESAEAMLKDHFKNPDANPVAIAYCQAFNMDQYLSVEPMISLGPEHPRRLTYDPEYSAFPWDPRFKNMKRHMVDVSQICGPIAFNNKHAGVIKGVREVRLPNGQIRTDFLVEDSSPKPAMLPIWQNGAEWHFWVESHALVSNIFEMAYF